MIRIAQEHSKFYPNIDYVIGDIMTQQFTDNHFDCIATLTTLHHLQIETILRKVKKALKPGGILFALTSIKALTSAICFSIVSLILQIYFSH
jgi:2-polyprenyl-3-methyl-5-hydroxy-6-metoxy-1,4-benzoquinol methylase